MFEVAQSKMRSNGEPLALPTLGDLAMSQRIVFCDAVIGIAANLKELPCRVWWMRGTSPDPLRRGRCLALETNEARYKGKCIIDDVICAKNMPYVYCETKSK